MKHARPIEAEFSRVNLMALIDDLHEDTDCQFDHAGDCQEHCWFGLDGDECPNAHARRIVAAWYGRKPVMKHAAIVQTSPTILAEGDADRGAQ